MKSENKPSSIKALLTCSSNQLSSATLDKLRSSRTHALNRQRTYTSPVLSWIYAHTGLPVMHNLTRPLPLLISSIMLAALLLGGGSIIDQYVNEHEISEVDMAILTDEMPLHVYVD